MSSLNLPNSFSNLVQLLADQYREIIAKFEDDIIFDLNMRTIVETIRSWGIKHIPIQKDYTKYRAQKRRGLNRLSFSAVRSQLRTIWKWIHIWFEESFLSWTIPMEKIAASSKFHESFYHHLFPLEAACQMMLGTVKYTWINGPWTGDVVSCCYRLGVHYRSCVQLGFFWL